MIVSSIGVKCDCIKYRCYIIQAANNKGANQTAWMHRLISAFVVSYGIKQVFS